MLGLRGAEGNPVVGVVNLRETNPTYCLGIEARGGGGGGHFGGFQAEGRETYSFGVLGLRGGKPIC